MRMGALWVRFRAEFRERWRAWLGIAVLIGLAAGVVMGLIAGARRTDSAYGRFLDRSSAADLVLIDQRTTNVEASIDLEAAARLDGVEVAVLGRSFYVHGGRTEDRELPVFPVAVMTSPDGELGRSVERRQVVEGRRPDPGRPDELLVSYEAARRFDLHPGSVLELDFLDLEGLLAAGGEVLDGLPDRLSGQDDRAVDIDPLGRAQPHQFRVVGVSVSPVDFPPIPGNLPPLVYPTPAFERTVAGDPLVAGALFIRLDPDTPVAEYQAELERQNPLAVVAYAVNGDEHAKAASRLINIQARGLSLLAGLVAAAATLIVVQTLLRQAWFSADDHPALRALGMSRLQLLILAALRAGVIAVAAGGVAVVVALALSPVFPFDLAARAEPAPGFDVDGAALALGVAVTAAAVLIISLSADAWGILPRWSEGGRSGRRRGGRRWRWGPLTLRLGSRLALDPGRGRAAIPVRSTVITLTTGVVAAAFAVTAVASLDHLTNTPRLYGWQWDAQLGGFALPDISEPLTEGLLRNPDVESFAVGAIAQLEVEGVRVDGYAVDDMQGTVPAALLEGRRPTGAGEIVLGSVTLDEVGAAVGDTVEVSSGARAAAMEVVGRGVFPNIGDAGQLGRGARLTFTGLEELAPGTPRTVALLEVADGREVDRELAELRRAMALYPVYEDRAPDDLVNVGESNTFPTLVGLTIGVVAGATLIHTLVTSIRRQRRELALLKAIGLGHRHLFVVVAWQATILSTIALLIGLPIGVAAGRWAWIALGHQFGFEPESVIPMAALATVFMAVLALATVVAAGPAWAAARTRAANALREE